MPQLQDASLRRWLWKHKEARVIGGTSDELALVALGLEALTQRLDAVGRAHPAGLDSLRNQLFNVLSRPGPSFLHGETESEESVAMGPLLHDFDEAALRLRVSRSTVERAVKAGELPVVHLGRAARIRPEDLESFVEHLAADGAPEAMTPMSGGCPPTGHAQADAPSAEGVGRRVAVVEEFAR